jgi:hypothetical protein
LSSLARRYASSHLASPSSQADVRSPQDLFREAFALPPDEQPLGEVHAVLSMHGKSEAYVRVDLSHSRFAEADLSPQSGKLYLSTSFLTFTSLDRRSCRLTLPLATVRRVEKLAPGQDGTVTGAFALSLTLFHGLRIVRTSFALQGTTSELS